jgi:hypothetical protein
MNENNNWPEPPFDVKTVHDVSLRIHTKIDGGFKGTDDAGYEWIALYDLLEPSTLKVYRPTWLNAGGGDGKVPAKFEEWLKEERRYYEAVKLTNYGIGEYQMLLKIIAQLYRDSQQTDGPAAQPTETPVSGKEGDRWVAWRTENGWSMRPDASWIKHGNISSVRNTESLYALFQSETGKAPKAPKEAVPVQQGEVPAEVMEWIKTTCKEMYPYVYDDDAHALSVDALRHECKKIAIAMYHKMKEDQTELLRTLIIEQAKELSDIQDQITEATRHRDQYKEWWEKSEKAFAELADKALEISKERDAMRAQLEDIANETGWEYVKTFLAKYPKQ